MSINRSSHLRIGDRFLWTLGLVLMGYALMGRSFAYLGIKPLFVGEAMLVFGLLALACCHQWSRLFANGLIWIMLAFMAWCAAQTVPYLSTYKIDALRDAVVWGYGIFALIVAMVLIERPERLAIAVGWFGRFVPVILWAGPLLVVISRGIPQPDAPWAPGVELLSIKGGDYMVQLCAAMAMLVAQPAIMSTAATMTLLPLNFALSISGRAAFVAFGASFALIVALRPGNALVWRLTGVLAILLAILWATELDVGLSDGGRTISFKQLTSNIESIFSDDGEGELHGTRQWRIDWWTAILNYTVHGDYFWTGKGFGVNLANDDGFQVTAGDSLRSPHNGHLTVLARAGVPGLALWIAVQLGWAGMILKQYVVSYWYRDHRWAAVFMVLLVYWVAHVINAAFDVFLEGPIGGIWFWCIYGTGIAAIWIHRHRPEVLYAPQAIQVIESAYAPARRRPQRVGSRTPRAADSTSAAALP